MSTVKAVVEHGRVELKAPSDWPDGTIVVVQPETSAELFGIREEDWPSTPEAATAWWKWYESLEPLIFTDEETANWEKARKDQKAYEKSTFAEHAAKLRRTWE